MSRQSTVAVQNNFTGGLITEGTALNFPKNAATDTDNCVFQYTGSVKRRSGIDFEDDTTAIATINPTGGDVFVEYRWTQATDSGDYSIIVQQQGSTLHFFNCSSDTSISPNYIDSRIDLSSFKPADGVLDPALFPCNFAQGNGVLLCVSRAIEPLVIKFDPAEQTLSATPITIQIRDFIGLDDGYADTQRPVFSTVAAMTSDPVGVVHYYNLLNQGWWAGTITTGAPSSTSALGQWDAGRTDMPSNCDDYRMYQASTTDLFDPTIVDVVSGGLGLATKGHFVLDVGSIDRRQVAIDQGYTIDISGNAGVLVPAATGSLNTQLTSTVINRPSTASSYSAASTHAFDSNYNATSSIACRQSSASSSNAASVNISGITARSGKNYSVPIAVNNAIVFGYKITSSYSCGSKWSVQHANNGAITYGGASLSTTLRLYASNSAPSSATDGVLLGTTTYAPSASRTSVSIDSNDKVTTYAYVWVTIIVGGINITSAVGGFAQASLAVGCSEIEIYQVTSFNNTGSFTEPDKTTERPQCVAYYAGRAWYAGIQHDTSSNTLYFSQIIERDDQYGRCYQQNDPTSNIYFDLLATDGGYVKIPEMGAIKYLFVYQTSLVVLADNGVWLIRGSSGAGFLATDYVVRKLSSLGTQSPLSVVDVDGVPYWWGEAGILRLMYNPQFDSFSVDSITDTTIRSFYLNIPMTDRSQVKAAYDPFEKYCYWLYTDVTDMDAPAGAGYNRVLVYNVRSEAFFPWRINIQFDINDFEITPVIQGMIFVQDGAGLDIPTLKFTTIYIDNMGTQQMTYSDQLHSVVNYIDWFNYSLTVDDPTMSSDYSSYFVSGYEVDGQMQKFSQANYVTFLLEEDDTLLISPGAFMRGIWDFTISGDSGKWSTKQQLYNDGLSNRTTNYRRLKVRGKGKCLQFKVESETGKPFAVIGWSSFKSMNSQV